MSFSASSIPFVLHFQNPKLGTLQENLGHLRMNVVLNLLFPTLDKSSHKRHKKALGNHSPSMGHQVLPFLQAQLSTRPGRRPLRKHVRFLAELLRQPNL